MRINFMKLARHIAKELKPKEFDNLLQSSGYYVVREWDGGNFTRAVDVHKGIDGKQKYYGVYVSYEDDSDGEFFYTEHFNIKELASLLREIAHNGSYLDEAEEA